MATIPASALVDITSSVLSAGGSELDLYGIILTTNTRVPIGTVKSFANDDSSVSDFFGSSSDEATMADIYFAGFDTATVSPDAVYFAQYNMGAVPAWLRGADESGYKLTQLQKLSGTISVTVDGSERDGGTVSLATATSFSAGAALIQDALNASPETLAEVTADIATEASAFTGSINGYLLTISEVTSGSIVPGTVITGDDIADDTIILEQIDGDDNADGTYVVSVSQSVDSESMTGAYGLMTVSEVTSGTLSVGQALSGTGLDDGTVLYGLGSGEGTTGTYYVQSATEVDSTTITATPIDVDVSYDSTSGGYLIESGFVGDASTIDFASGTLAKSLGLTEATGATVSQGADAAQPEDFMDNVVKQTTDWVTFMHMFDPDNDDGCDQKLLFAKWTNAQDNRYAYIARDTDITPTESDAATSSFGYQVTQTYSYSGVCPIYDPDSQGIDSFVCGTTASINTEATKGRITFAFRGQDGLTATVTDETVADNLIANGYNFYAAYATANQSFTMFQPGQVSGDFAWLDSYINQIWLNNKFQLALVELLTEVNSVGYYTGDYALVKAALDDPIDQGLNFGAIRTGVNLSTLQKAQINNSAGNTTAATSVVTNGYYLQIVDASSTVRAKRGSPPINFWYSDGGSIQKIELASIMVQ